MVSEGVRPPDVSPGVPPVEGGDDDPLYRDVLGREEEEDRPGQRHQLEGEEYRAEN